MEKFTYVAVAVIIVFVDIVNGRVYTDNLQQGKRGVQYCDARRISNAYSTPAGRIAAGDTVTVTCNSGYTLWSTSTQTCFRGSWFGITPRCIRGCDPLFISHGHVTPGGVIAHGDDVTVTCDSGYKSWGSLSTQSCLHGSWIGARAKCISAYSSCYVSYVRNGYISPRGRINHGGTARVTCHTGYSPSISTISCDDGSWNSVPHCNRVYRSCRAPSVINGYTSTIGNIVHGQSTTVTCNTGYNLQNGVSSTIRCNDGSWGYITRCYDVTDPIATCPSDIIAHTTDQSPVTVTIPFVVSCNDTTDSDIQPICNQTNQTPFPVGVTLVSCTCKDRSRNTDDCSFEVVVIDATDPIANCPNDTTAHTTYQSPGTATIPFMVSCDDNIDSDIQPLCNYTTQTPFPVGVTLVSCTCQDRSQNTDECSFEVAVRDATGPIAICPNDITVDATEQSQTTATVYFLVACYDNIDNGIQPNCNKTSQTVFTVGVTIISCTCEDRSQNTEECSFEVTVKDVTDPIATCPHDIIAHATEASQTTATVPFVVSCDDEIDSDIQPNCNQTNQTIFAVGVTIVSCTCEDRSQNTDECSFKITVKALLYRDDRRCGGDFLAPNGEVAQCNPDGIYSCCSPSNWCGITADHCDCENCIDYRVTALSYRDDNQCGCDWFAPNGEVAQCNPNGNFPCCSPHNWCGITADYCDCENCIDYRVTAPALPYRDDNQCGGDWLAPNGEVAQCNPDGIYPCCSPYNWCGISADHCECDDCIDYRAATSTNYITSPF